MKPRFAVHEQAISMKEAGLTQKTVANTLPTYPKENVSKDVHTIFMQDAAPAHTAIKTQKWLLEYLLSIVEKGVWPNNPSDLHPIENLWSSIMQAELDKRKARYKYNTARKMFGKYKKGISPSIFENWLMGFRSNK